MGRPVRMVRHLFHTLNTGQTGWTNDTLKVCRCWEPTAS